MTRGYNDRWFLWSGLHRPVVTMIKVTQTGGYYDQGYTDRWLLWWTLWVAMRLMTEQSVNPSLHTALWPVPAWAPFTSILLPAVCTAAASRVDNSQVLRVIDLSGGQIRQYVTAISQFVVVISPFVAVIRHLTWLVSNSSSKNRVEVRVIRET